MLLRSSNDSCGLRQNRRACQHETLVWSHSWTRHAETLRRQSHHHRWAGGVLSVEPESFSCPKLSIWSLADNKRFNTLTLAPNNTKNQIVPPSRTTDIFVFLLPNCLVKRHSHYSTQVNKVHKHRMPLFVCLWLIPTQTSTRTPATLCAQQQPGADT